MHPVKKYLNENELSPSKLAKQLGISVQHLYLIFTCQRWPSYDLARRISKITGISVCFLWTYNRHNK